MAVVVRRPRSVLLGSVRVPAGGQRVRGWRAPAGGGRGLAGQIGGAGHGAVPPRDDRRREVITRSENNGDRDAPNGRLRR